MSPPRERRFHVVAGHDEAGDRADVVLARHTAGLSRRAVRQAALAGHLRIDGVKQPPSTRVRSGAHVELVLTDELDAAPAEPGDGLVAPRDGLVVLRITDNFVYVDKPAGLHTTGRTPGDPDCLATRVACRYPECHSASPDPREGGALHRLDAATSGVVAFARHATAWSQGRTAFATGRVRKRYLALCHPPPTWPPHGHDRGGLAWVRPVDPFTPLSAAIVPWRTPAALSRTAVSIDAPLGHGSNRDRVQVRVDGQPARSIIAPIADGPTGFLLCELHLVTGRRHQARVHTASLGMPIVGDPRYGDRDGATRLMLHAVALDLGRALPTETQVNTASHTDLFGPFVTAAPA
ncbi:MAG: RluA family pseudouridine synthase [Myxococcales bacterium FL481]|nr:MAG: RluA family pseudouridine synthase [Myxococcales bacterium FL481]